jgi:ketosteroid isomerase-like protein
MKRLISFITILLIIAGCTKQKSEEVKEISKPIDENNVVNAINGFISAFNSHDIEKAVSFLDLDFKGVVADSDNVVGIFEARNAYYSLMNHYPEGKWNIKCEEVNISGDFAYVMTIGSFMVLNPIENKIIPVYSERSIRILKRQKEGTWKIFRYIAVPAFTYEE